MAESLLKNLGISVSDIDLFAVSKGPGSFTGVRIGVAAAKGLAWGAGKPVCGVSTLEAMAYQTAQPEALICPVMDARRNQVYNALFTWVSGKLARLCDDRAISLEDLTNELHSVHNELHSPHTATAALPMRQISDSSVLAHDFSFLAPDSKIILVGDGALISYDHLASAGIPCRLAPDLMRYQTAYGVALAALNNRHIAATELEPCYLRPSQAERERSKAKE